MFYAGYFTWNPGGTPCPSYFPGSGSPVVPRPAPPGIGYFSGWNPGGTPCPSYFPGSAGPQPFEAGLLAYLSANASVTVYAGHIPQDAATPALSFTLVSEEPRYTLKSAAGLTIRNYQFSCWAASYNSSLLLERRLRAVLHGYRGWMRGTFVSSCRLQNSMDMPYEPNVDDSDDGTYQRIAEYRIFLRESIPAF